MRLSIYFLNGRFLRQLNEDTLKRRFWSLLFYLYFLSVFILEKTIIPNRIILAILLITSLIIIVKKKNFFRKDLFVFNSLLILATVTFIFTNCGLDNVLLFIVIPIFSIFSIASHGSGSLELKSLFSGLYLSIITIFLVCILNQIIFLYESYFLNYEWREGLLRIQNSFWWNKLTHNSLLDLIKLHPSYFSMFALSSLIWELNSFKLYKSGYLKRTVIRIVFLFVIILLVASKMALISLVFMLVISMLLEGRKLSPTIKLFLLLLILITPIILASVPSLRDRVLNDYRIFKSEEFRFKNNSTVSERLFLWSSSFKIILNNPKGTPCEDSKDLIFSLDNGRLLNDTKKNSHNNFLEFGLLYGYIGVLILMFIVTWIFIKGLRSKSTFLVQSTCLFFLFSLVESTLVREWGVIHFAVLLQVPFILNKVFKSNSNE